MKSNSLIALMLTGLLSISLVTWAWAGCNTSYPAVRISGGEGSSIIASPDPGCLNPWCDGSYIVKSAMECWSDRCTPGSCGSPASSQVCDGASSPWTKTVYAIKTYSQQCYFKVPSPVLGGQEGCFPLLGATKNTYACRAIAFNCFLLFALPIMPTNSRYPILPSSA